MMRKVNIGFSVLGLIVGALRLPTDFYGACSIIGLSVMLFAAANDQR